MSRVIVQVEQIQQNVPINLTMSPSLLNLIISFESNSSLWYAFATMKRDVVLLVGSWIYTLEFDLYKHKAYGEVDVDG